MMALAGCPSPAAPTRERPVNDTTDRLVDLCGHLREVVLPSLGQLVDAEGDVAADGDAGVIASGMLAERGQDDLAEVSAQVDESVGRVVHRALPGRRSRRRAAGEGHHSTLLYSRCRPSALAPGSLPATRHDATSHAHRYHRLPRQRER